MENDHERSERYNYLFQRGWLTLNEVRLLCGLLPLEADLQLILLENMDYHIHVPADVSGNTVGGAADSCAAGPVMTSPLSVQHEGADVPVFRRQQQ